MSDGRRRQYVPVSTTLLWSRTGTAILERFGLEGIGVYVALLVAAKKGSPQGTIELRKGLEWADLGLGGFEPKDWTLDDLLKLLGQRKKTSRRRVGRLLYVTFSRWEDWNQTPRKQVEAARKSRKRAENTADNRADMRGKSVAVTPPEVEVELEVEEELVTAKAVTPKRDDLWDVLTDELGEVGTPSERGRRNKALKELRLVGASADELRRRIGVYRKKWPGVEVTATALAANWSLLDGTVTELDADQRRERHAQEVRRRMEEAGVA